MQPVVEPSIGDPVAPDLVPPSDMDLLFRVEERANLDVAIDADEGAAALDPAEELSLQLATPFAADAHGHSAPSSSGYQRLED